MLTLNVTDLYIVAEQTRTGLGTEGNEKKRELTDRVLKVPTFAN